MKFVTSSDLFFRFARELEAPHWRPYYARWERVGRPRLDHPRKVRAEMPRSYSRRRLRGLIELIEAAGYSGKAEVMRPKGGVPFLLGHFWRSRLGPAGPAGARACLDVLASVMRASTS